MYRNDDYMTIHDALVKIKLKWPDTNPPNPFPLGFDIFNSITVDGTAVPTYGLTINNLWSIFNQWFARLAVSKKVPPLKYEWIYNGTVYFVADDSDKALYIWQWLTDAVGWYCKANRNRWEHIILADVAKYDPITNYKMEETSGTTSTVARTRSSIGKQTTKTQVYPYDLNNASGDGKPESKVTVEQGTLKSESGHDTEFSDDASITGYDDDSKQLEWDGIKTPKGNATSVNKLLRSGNIGVTTSQQMIQSEYDLRQFNVLQEFMNEVAKYSLILDWDSALNNQY